MKTRWYLKDFIDFAWEKGLYYLDSPSFMFMGALFSFRIFKETGFRHSFILKCSDPQRLLSAAITLKHVTTDGNILKMITCPEIGSEKNIRNLILTRNLLYSLERSHVADLIIQCELYIKRSSKIKNTIFYLLL